MIIMEDITNPTPIVIDPEIQDVLNKTVTFKDIRESERKRERERVWSDDQQVETVDDLIESLKEYRERVGGDARVQSFEGGHSLHVFAREYDNGDAVVEL